jgi:hypothetical protein
VNSEPQQTEDDDIDIALLEYLQTLTVAERLALNDATQEAVRALRKAGEEFYGFDPRAVAAAADGES